MKTFTFIIFMLVSINAFANDARVVASEPVYTASTQYHKVCTPVTEQHRSIGGTLLGGAIGAAIGNQVGGGSGRDIATAVGAVTGAAVGQRRCVNEPFTVQQISEYKVTVEINGSFYTVYRSFGPAVVSRIPVTIAVK